MTINELQRKIILKLESLLKFIRIIKIYSREIGVTKVSIVQRYVVKSDTSNVVELKTNSVVQKSK